MWLKEQLKTIGFVSKSSFVLHFFQRISETKDVMEKAQLKLPYKEAI